MADDEREGSIACTRSTRRPGLARPPVNLTGGLERECVRRCDVLVTRRGGLCYCPGGDSCVGGLSWMCVRLVASAPVASAVAVAVAVAAAALATIVLAATAALALSPARTPPPPGPRPRHRTRAPPSQRI